MHLKYFSTFSIIGSVAFMYIPIDVHIYEWLCIYFLFLFTDVNECNVDNAGCEGDCINTDGGYR